MEGNLTADPRLNVTSTGKAVANLRIAVSSRRKNRDGDYMDTPPVSYDVTVWGPVAENVPHRGVQVRGPSRGSAMSVRSLVKGEDVRGGSDAGSAALSQSSAPTDPARQATALYRPNTWAGPSAGR